LRVATTLHGDARCSQLNFSNGAADADAADDANDADDAQRANE